MVYLRVSNPSFHWYIFQDLSKLSIVHIISQMSLKVILHINTQTIRIPYFNRVPHDKRSQKTSDTKAVSGE